MVGSAAEWLRDLALGIDNRPVDPNEDRKSAGSECTYEKDLTDPSQIRAEIDEMARDAARWLDKRAIFARTPVDADAFLSTGASAWNRALPRAEFAATTAVVSAIMNLDDFVVLR